MNTAELLDDLQNKAHRDADLRKTLLKTREEKNPVDAFCRKCQELGYPIYVMDLIHAGEEFYGNMRRSTNGGGENSPKLQGEDDFYELFMASLMSAERREKQTEEQINTNRYAQMKAQIEAQIAQYPVCEYAFIQPEDIPFLEQVRYICRTECPQYGTSWSCPPAVGTVEECRERCMAYSGGFLFTTMTEVKDMANMEETLSTRFDHEEVTREIRELFYKQGCEVLVLSTESCAVCEKCAYPEAPCRHPDQMFPCVESYGILVTELAQKCEISFMSAGNVVTWFSLILYQ